MTFTSQQPSKCRVTPAFPFVESFSLADEEGNEDSTSELITPRTGAAFTSVSFACALYIIACVIFERTRFNTSHRRASYSVPLVWYDSSLLSPPLFARLHLRAQRASPRIAEPWRGDRRRKSNFDGESNRQDIIVTRSGGEEMRLAPTICIKDVGSMGDAKDEGAGEGQSAPNSSYLFVSNKVRPGPNDYQRTRERLSLSPARFTPLFFPRTTLAVEPSASASDSSLAAVSKAVLLELHRPPHPWPTDANDGANSDERLSSWKWRGFIEIGIARM
ncbi:hypothetical protein F5J12DRAFT_895618 [Pisolithus orientalis]|uniref:uncharacterized protein n=1 Tax=Pisolithus orientalis TaxID=936130 RepID=UPI0022240FEE|nr:uncharacterized protein F5J12DRAFT_895618 [Pisolithus orientalis]KAI5998425.1 hypothetical protein F5J12DRAFT_895618 [Pisolithus orientalis]